MRTAFKEIAIIITAVLLMAGGLGITLTLETANGLALIAIILFGIGGAIFAYVIKSATRAR